MQAIKTNKRTLNFLISDAHLWPVPSFRIGFQIMLGCTQGVQITNDFLNIAKASEIKDRSKKAPILFVSMGDSFSFGFWVFYVLGNSSLF